MDKSAFPQLIDFVLVAHPENASKDGESGNRRKSFEKSAATNKHRGTSTAEKYYS
jgi:hypothetical protein